MCLHEYFLYIIYSNEVYQFAFSYRKMLSYVGFDLRIFIGWKVKKKK